MRDNCKTHFTVCVVKNQNNLEFKIIFKIAKFSDASILANQFPISENVTTNKTFICNSFSHLASLIKRHTSFQSRKYWSKISDDSIQRFSK